jgi:hypothetical protein
VAAWQDTRDTLQLYTQVVGKVRLANEPLTNHWWNTTLYLTARGLTTSLMTPARGSAFQIDFDFVAHRLDVTTVDGDHRSIPLGAPVADFYAEVMRMLDELDVSTEIWPVPVEIPGAIPFADDRVHASYDGEAVRRFWQALIAIEAVFKQFRSRFVGKASPVHYFWGAGDLAVTRFSGRRAPPHPGGIPNLPDWVTREAYSHEVSSAGFWPGGGAIDYPAFYAYAYPEPAGFADAHVEPDGAFYNKDYREFLLPYDRVARSSSPDDTLLEFLQSTYEVAATLGGWDRAALERPTNEELRTKN